VPLLWQQQQQLLGQSKGKKLRKNKRSRQETAATKTVIMSLCELYCLPGLVSYEKNTGNPISGQQ
jgi:hypothetical protein